MRESRTSGSGRGARGNSRPYRYDVANSRPVAASAQQPGVPVIGFLSGRSSGDPDDVMAAFREGLGESGFVEGRNLVIECRWAEGRYRLPALAADLVRLKVAAIYASSMLRHALPRTRP
jgi:hypothetical protein